MFEPKSMAGLSLEEKFQILLDERDIRGIYDRYSRACARADLDMFKSCFHDDAIDHHPPTYDGKISEFYKIFDTMAEKTAATIQYYLTNILIELDGDVAYTECYGLSAKGLNERAYNGDQVMRVSGLRYLHRMERRNGEWRIAEVWFVPEWAFYKQVPEQIASIGIYASAKDRAMNPIPARRNKNDISYVLDTLKGVSGN